MDCVSPPCAGTVRDDCANLRPQANANDCGDQRYGTAACHAAVEGRTEQRDGTSVTVGNNVVTVHLRVNDKATRTSICRPRLDRSGLISTTPCNLRSELRAGSTRLLSGRDVNDPRVVSAWAGLGCDLVLVVGAGILGLDAEVERHRDKTLQFTSVHHRDAS